MTASASLAAATLPPASSWGGAGGAASGRCAYQRSPDGDDVFPGQSPDDDDDDDDDALDSAELQPPAEPLNCCGSGCSNCVWVDYFKELNEYNANVAAAAAAADGDVAEEPGSAEAMLSQTPPPTVDPGLQAWLRSPPPRVIRLW